MGFDVSYHPVDIGLVQTRLLPYLRGDGAIDDLVADGVRLAKVRFRANAWGLGATAAAAAAQPKKSKKSAPPPADGFDPHLSVWGRPFFVTAPADEVSGVVDAYLRADPAGVDAIARSQLDLIGAGWAASVTPDEDGHLPDDAALAAGLRQELDLIRASHPHLADGRPVRMPDGDTADPEDVFLFNLPLAVVAFAAQFAPGWMARGHVWPTALVTDAGLDADGLVESAGFVFEPLLQAIGGWEEAFEPTIAQNYTLGGAVRPANVPAFRAWWQAHRDALVAPFAAEGDPAAGQLAHQKILEAARDAERRGFAFVEATEVYSGFSGVMN